MEEEMRGRMKMKGVKGREDKDREIKWYKIKIGVKGLDDKND